MEINDKNYLTRKNKFCFAASGFGQNLIGATVNSYLMFFMTHITAIGYFATTVIMFIAKTIDAFNDPFMGVVVDKTHSRMGKLRPYLLAAPIPLALVTVLMFVVPGFERPGRIAYIAMLYVLWDIFYTIGDIPFWSSPAAMTPNPKERVKFITFSRLFHSAGGALPLLLLPLTEIFCGAKTKESYLAVAVISGVVGGALYMLAFFGTTERVVSSAASPSVKECFRYLFRNKPLLVVVLANVLGFGRALRTVAGLYLTTYLCHDMPSFMTPALGNTFMMAGFAVSGVLSMLFTPMVVKKYNYRTITWACCVLGITGDLILLAVGLSAGCSIYLLLGVQTITGMAYGMACNVNYAMISESIDYLEWKEGARAEGVSISMQTLMNKLVGAIQSGVMPMLMLLVGFIEPTDDNPSPPQTDGALQGLLIVVCVVPVIGWILTAVCMKFYDFVGEKREKIYAELYEQRKNSSEVRVLDIV